MERKRDSTPFPHIFLRQKGQEKMHFLHESFPVKDTRKNIA